MVSHKRYTIHVRTTEKMTVTNDHARLFHADFQKFFGLSSHQKDKNVSNKVKRRYVINVMSLHGKSL